MRDFELEGPGRQQRRAAPEATREAAPDQATARPFVPARSPALDAAAVIRLQRTAGNAGVVQLLAGEEPEVSPVLGVVGSGGGAPLDAGTRSTMESAFGTSFGDVRVHTDERASRSAEAVGANAYTVGSDVVFRSGHFDPGTPTGQRTIAHELAHVVQQSQGPVAGTEAAGGIRVSDPSDHFERAAERTADDVMTSVQAPRAEPAPQAGAGAPVAQRALAAEEEDESAQP
jgi:hypothetical protein